MVWLGLLAVGVVLYLTWSLLEKRRHAADRAVATDIASLGADLVPTSLHPVIDPDRCIGSGACVAACPEDKVIGIVHGQAHLINPLACIGHGACMAACPVSAITLVFGTAQRGLELPVVDPHFETNREGVYIVGELGGMGLIRNAIEQGRQAAVHIAGGARRGRGDVLDAVVVGAGPAGMGAALELKQRGLRTVALDEGELGGTIVHYPRAKIVMTGAIQLPGHESVGGKTMSKEELVALWQEVREASGLDVQTGVRATGLRAENDEWVVETSTGEQRAANVVLALGRRGAPKRLEVPGEDLPKVSYRLREPEAFAGMHVLVVGGGNAAADCAIALVESGKAASVTLSYRRAELARLRSSVREKIEAQIQGGAVRALMPSEVLGITASAVRLRKGDGRIEEIPNDAVIVQIGGTSPASLLGTFGIETVEKRGER